MSVNCRLIKLITKIFIESLSPRYKFGDVSPEMIKINEEKENLKFTMQTTC